MLLLEEQRKLFASLRLIGRWMTACIFVLLTQFTLSLVPRFFSASPYVVQFAFSALVLLFVLGFGGWFRRLLGVYASAPAFVLSNIMFIWGFYIAVVRQAVSRLMDGLFNVEVALVIIGLGSIISRDPGLVTREFPHSDKIVESSDFGIDPDNENSLSFRRVRYCKICKTYIKGFDHHCPAFGNCIGQNNYFLFMVLLVGFLSTEASYLVCSFQFGKSQDFDNSQFKVNWKKYPEFQVIQSEPGEGLNRMKFRNPYDKGVLQNVKEFLTL